MYELIHGTQTKLPKLNPDNFEVHDTISPFTDYPSNFFPNNDVTHVSKNPCREISLKSNRIDLKHHSFHLKFNFTYCQLPSQKLLNLMQLLCDFQDVYSHHKSEFGLIDKLFQITLKADVELKKNVSQKFSFTFGIKYNKFSMLWIKSNAFKCVQYN